MDFLKLSKQPDISLELAEYYRRMAALKADRGREHDDIPDYPRDRYRLPPNPTAKQRHEFDIQEARYEIWKLDQRLRPLRAEKKTLTLMLMRLRKEYRSL